MTAPSCHGIIMAAQFLTRSRCRAGESRHLVSRVARSWRLSPTQGSVPQAVSLAHVVLQPILLARELLRTGSTRRNMMRELKAAVSGNHRRLSQGGQSRLVLIRTTAGMLSVPNLGPQVEKVMGKTKFVVIYLLAGVSGNALSCIVNPRMPVSEPLTPKEVSRRRQA